MDCLRNEVLQKIEVAEEKSGGLCRNENTIPIPTLPLKGMEYEGIFPKEYK
jgi:hypothetical protein